MMSEESKQSAIIVLTTTETQIQAEQLAQILVEQKLAACVQILPPMIAIYRWQGKIEKTQETLLLIKTQREVYPALEVAINSNHAYQTPEIIALPVETGAKNYLAWLAESLGRTHLNL